MYPENKNIRMEIIPDLSITLKDLSLTDEENGIVGSIYDFKRFETSSDKLNNLNFNKGGFKYTKDDFLKSFFDRKVIPINLRKHLLYIDYEAS